MSARRTPTAKTGCVQAVSIDCLKMPIKLRITDTAGDGMPNEAAPQMDSNRLASRFFRTWSASKTVPFIVM